MSGVTEQSLFFVSLPDLRKLCSVILSVQAGDSGELRNTQIKTCRELLLLYSDIVAAPVFDSYGEIIVVMAIPFFKKGLVQAYAQRHNLQMATPQRVAPGILQVCLSYSLTARLAPSWNKAGSFLIAGKDFLSESGRLNAIVMELNTNESQLCVSMEASTVRLPPARLEDFELPPLVVKNFLSQPDAVVQTNNNWCYVLPSMKRGQIVSVSRRLPADSPFQSYADLQSHWNSVYGYRLPQLAEEEVIYCSVYFKLVGQRLFTYPLSCLRAVPVQRCPRVDLRGALGSFAADLRDRLRSVCGFLTRMTSQPCYHTNSLLSTAQMSGGRPLNLTSKSSSRLALTQLPAARPPRPSSTQPGAQHPAQSQGDAGPARTQENLHAGPARTQENLHAGPARTQENLHAGPASRPHQGGASGRGWTPCLSSSSSSSSSLASLYPSSVPPPSSRPPAPVHPGQAASKMVPIFRNKGLTRHVNVTQLLAQKRQHGAPSAGQKRPAPAFSSSVPSSSFSSSSKHPQESPRPPPPPPPPTSAPRFTPRPPWTEGLHPRSTMGQPPSQSHPAPPGRERVSGAGGPPPHPTPPPPPPRPMGPSDIPSNRGGDWFESKPKKSKVKDVDVEKCARSNQLSKVTTATLQAWLRGRGVAVRTKDRKEELVSKVMGVLSEA